MWRLSVQMFGGVICIIFVAFAIFMFGFLFTRLYIILSDIYKKRKTLKLNAKRRKSNVKTMIIAGSGGHTAEILKLVSSLGEAYTPRQYVVADTDRMSADKIHAFEKDRKGEGVAIKDSNLFVFIISFQYHITTIPRSREVKQSWLTTVGTTLYATLLSLPLVFSSRPDLTTMMDSESENDDEIHLESVMEKTPEPVAEVQEHEEALSEEHKNSKLKALEVTLDILCNGPGTCVPLCVAGFLLTLFGVKRVTIVFAESICRVTSLSLSGQILYWFADQILVQWPELQKHYPLTRYIGRTV
ncbi:hypothetical protein LSH36_358g02066 [Paralvinella palmiformis]|uniref:UDP-N-acetylglucosamine transferase subunit ALG14 n=1 Tax=Paralvinella palmiformis TaxID=53620 RepID=A0AAD9JES5_9ANNE|nr:hypothetical protein LSH36_358g02066 [Paralvinella palmiformis]